MSFFNQEKKKNVMTNSAPAEEKLLAWPDCYYNEREPALRKEMLDLAVERGLCPEEDKIREELFEIRYPEYGKKKAEVTKDVYLTAWINLRFVGNAVNQPFSKRGHIREVKKELINMGFEKMKAHGRKGEDLLYLEIKHLGTLYFYLCKEDKQYGSYILGLGHMSEDSVAGKAAAEAAAIAHTMPDALGLTEECRILTKAVDDAYRVVFPDSEELASMLK